MLPFAIIELVKEILRTINNRTEGMTFEQKQAEYQLGWNIAKPFLWPFLPQESKDLIIKLIGNE